MTPPPSEQQAISGGPFLLGPLLRYFSGLRFPWLFGIFAFIFGVDLIVPDLLPFADELMLGLGTLLLGAWRKRKQTKVIAASAQPPLPPSDKAQST
jgi:hypothetical protein